MDDLSDIEKLSYWMMEEREPRDTSYEARFNVREWDISVTWSGASDANDASTDIHIAVECLTEFRFAMYRETVIHKAGKFLGLRDIQVDDEWIDDDFIIKATDEAKVQQLFGDQKFCIHLRSYGPHELRLLGDDSLLHRKSLGGPHELQARADFFAHDDILRMRETLEFSLACLNALTAMGCIRPAPPQAPPGYTLASD